MQEQAEQQLIESRCRISRSALWAAQKQFYIENGIEIWSDRSVFKAARAYVADALAGLAVACLIDCLPRLKKDKPFYFIELGSGSGCFSYRFLQGLKRRLAAAPELQGLEIRYIMTDIIPDILAVWSSNSQLAPFCSDGTLSFGVFDPSSDNAICQDGGNSTQFDNPPFFIANSVFDTIAVDGFNIEGGEIQEIVADLYAATGLTHSQALKTDQVRMRLNKGDIVLPRYYNCELIDSLLADYARTFESAIISIPIGAFDIIRNLEKIATKGFALLVCSTGFMEVGGVTDIDVLRYNDLSFPLNFDAIRRYFEMRGAGQIFSPDEGISHITWLGVYGADGVPDLASARLAFEAAWTTPDGLLDADDLSSTRDSASAGSMRELAALMQLVSYDPMTFVSFVNRYFDLLEAEILSRPNHDFFSFNSALRRVDENIYSFAKKITPQTKVTNDPLALLINVWKRAQNAEPTLPDRSFFG